MSLAAGRDGQALEAAAAGTFLTVTSFGDGCHHECLRQKEVMMKVIRLIVLVLGMVLTGSALTAAPSWAHSEETEAGCVADAREESQLCRTVCKADLRVAKDLCQGIDPDCADACRAGEDVCREVPIADVAECLEKNCERPLEDAKALCREQFPAATPGSS